MFATAKIRFPPLLALLASGAALASPHHYGYGYQPYPQWGAPRYQAPAYRGPAPWYGARPYNRFAPVTPTPRATRPGTQAKRMTPAQPAQRKPRAKPKTGNTESNRTAFIKRLTPLIESENQRLVTLRAKVSRMLARLDQGSDLTPEQGRQLHTLAREYRVKGNPRKSAAARTDLLSRIDIIPLDLALAQAANESAWGRSRFAREGNNLFGVWTYDASKGIVPKRRGKGKTHLVRSYESIGESIAHYMHLLNSHPAYQKLRDIRAEQRARGERPDGHAMAAGLLKYSAKGEKYVALIRMMIGRVDVASLDSTARQG